MHPRLAAVIDYADRARTELIATVDAVPAPLREARPSAEAWSVAEILEHLMMVERGVAKLVALKLGEMQMQPNPPREALDDVPLNAVKLQQLADRSIRLAAPERVAPRGELSAAAALNALQETRGVLLDQLHAADGYALSTAHHPHPFFGPLDLYEWVYMTGGHELRHAAQIREVADQLAAH